MLSYQDAQLLVVCANNKGLYARLKNKNYPNFEIRVSSPFYLPENFYFPENVEEYSYVRNFYKDIAEKIGDGTYSESIKLDIETARLIVDSVEENEINQNKIAP